MQSNVVHRETVTPHQLLEAAQTYDGSAVTVRGWLRIAPERRHLLELEPEIPPPSGQACITVELDTNARAAALAVNDSYVLVEGVFYEDLAKDRVFLGMCHPSGVKVSSVRPDEK